MKRNMHENSLKSYDEILAELPNMRSRVFRLIQDSPNGITTEQIASKLNSLPHKISGRITELKEAGKIHGVAKGTTSGGKTCDVWAVKGGQIELF